MRQRGDRGRADCVAEEKFCMIFRAIITVRTPTNTEYTVTAQVGNVEKDFCCKRGLISMWPTDQS